MIARLINPKFSVSTHTLGSTTVVAFWGSAVPSATEELDEVLNRVILAEPKKILFDLKGLTFLSTVAMASMVRCANAISRRGGHARAINVREDIADIMRCCRLSYLLENKAMAA